MLVASSLPVKSSKIDFVKLKLYHKNISVMDQSLRITLNQTLLLLIE